MFLKSPDQAEERFLGIFNSAAPATRWMPAPWILVSVGPLDTFELRLEADARGRNAKNSTLIFDANLRFNFDRALLSSERRVFLTYNEIWRQETDGSELTNRRYVSIVDRAPPERTLAAFIEKIESYSRQHGEELLMMLAYHVRKDRYGPLAKLWPEHVWQIDIHQEVLPREYQSREELARLRSKIEQQRGTELDDSPEMASSVFNYMLTDAKFYNQPVLTVRLGASIEEAERLKRSITFFHIKENVFAVEKERNKGGSSSKAARLRKLPEQQRDGNQELGSDYRRQSHTLYPCAEWRLLEDDNGLLLLKWPCADIAMGDVVGVFVASEVQLLLNGADLFSDGQHQQPSTSQAKCMYFRFLSDQLVPMLPEKLDNHYSGVMNDFTRRMEAALAEGRFDDEPRSPARIDELALESGRSRPPQSLLELLYDAWDDERRTLANSRRSGARTQRQQSVVQTIEFDQFRQWPSLMHALARTPSFRERVERQAEWTAAVDMQPSFLLAALALAGAPVRAMNWASKLVDGRVQALAWDILAYDVEAIILCANSNLGLSAAAAAAANVASLMGNIGVMRDNSSLDRTLLTYGDLEDDAKKTELESIATSIRERRNLRFESLEKARQLINQAEGQQDVEYSLAEEVVDQCPKLEGQAAFNPTSFKFESTSKEAKAKLKADIKRRLDTRITNFDDRVDAAAKVDLLETGAALRPLLMWLDNREPDQEARQLICAVAEELIKWSSQAGIPALAARSEPTTGGRPSPEKTKKWWGDWTIALKTWSPLPDDVSVDRLAAAVPPADTDEISAVLQPVAASIAQLRHKVREIGRESLRGVANDLQRITLDELDALDRLAEIAFATATCRALKALALADIKNYYDQYLRSELTLLKGDGGSVEGVYESLYAIQVQWDELGRCLAPEHGPRALKPALEAAEALLAEIRKLPLASPKGRPLPRLVLAPAPNFESIEQRAAASRAARSV